jgi:hypothetical protein
MVHLLRYRPRTLCVMAKGTLSFASSAISICLSKIALRASISFFPWVVSNPNSWSFATVAPLSTVLFLDLREDPIVSGGFSRYTISEPYGMFPGHHSVYGCNCRSVVVVDTGSSSHIRDESTWILIFSSVRFTSLYRCFAFGMYSYAMPFFSGLRRRQ